MCVLGGSVLLSSFPLSLPFFSFKMASYSVVQQTSLELVVILLTEPSKGWDCRCEPPCLAPSFCFMF